MNEKELREIEKKYQIDPSELSYDDTWAYLHEATFVTVPALIAEVRRLRAALKEISEYNANEDFGRGWKESVDLLQDEAYTALKDGEQ